MMSQKANELSAQLLAAQRFATNFNANMQVVAGELRTGQRIVVDLPTMSALAYQSRALMEILDPQMAPTNPRSVAGSSARHAVNKPIPLVGGPFHGQQFHLDVAPDVYPALVGNCERIAYYRLDLNTHTTTSSRSGSQGDRD